MSMGVFCVPMTHRPVEKTNLKLSKENHFQARRCRPAGSKSRFLRETDSWQFFLYPGQRIGGRRKVFPKVVHGIQHDANLMPYISGADHRPFGLNGVKLSNQDIHDARPTCLIDMKLTLDV